MNKFLMTNYYVKRLI